MGRDDLLLRISFDARMNVLRRACPNFARPITYDGPAEAREAYEQAYERAFRRAATFERADAPSHVSVPPELNRTPLAEWWSEGTANGHYAGNGLRSALLGPLLVQLFPSA